MFIMNPVRLQSISWAIVLTIIISVPMVTAQESPSPTPASTQEQTLLPPNSNPTQRTVIPKKTQTPAQQLTDQQECYNWTCEISNWDPYEAYDAMVEQGYTVFLDPEEKQRGLICLATLGAVAGAVAGEMVSNPADAASIGAAIAISSGLIQTPYLIDPDDPQALRAISRFERNLVKWDRKFSGCMRKKDYRVLSH